MIIFQNILQTTRDQRRDGARQVPAGAGLGEYTGRAQWKQHRAVGTSLPVRKRLLVGGTVAVADEEDQGWLLLGRNAGHLLGARVLAVLASAHSW